MGEVLSALLKRKPVVDLEPVRVPKATPIHDLPTADQAAAAWLWQGYLARGDTTLLVSQWKSGKTTLLSVLLSKMHTGGELAKHEVLQSSAVVVSEEGPARWRRRSQKLDFGPFHLFMCRPFAGKPRLRGWEALVKELGRLRREEAIDLAVIDTMATLTPAGVENNADYMLRVLAPLEELTAAGMAVLLLHHPRKGAVRAGEAARGTGALAAYIDISIEMNYPANYRGAGDRRRRLSAWSRHEETPRELVVELTQDGRDYTLAPDGLDAETDRGLDVIREVLGRSPTQLTRRGILKRWPEAKPPSDATLWRWLDRSVSLGQVSQAGAGRAGDPFRYWLADRDVPWEPDVFEELAELNGF